MNAIVSWKSVFVYAIIDLEREKPAKEIGPL